MFGIRSLVVIVALVGAIVAASTDTAQARGRRGGGNMMVCAVNQQAAETEAPAESLKTSRAERLPSVAAPRPQIVKTHSGFSRGTLAKLYAPPALSAPASAVAGK